MWSSDFGVTLAGGKLTLCYSLCRLQIITNAKTKRAKRVELNLPRIFQQCQRVFKD